MKLKDFTLKKIKLGSNLVASAQQALVAVEKLRDQNSLGPYLVTLEPQLFQHWQSEAAELWVVEGAELCAALKFHVCRREFGHLIRVEDLIVAPQLRGTRLIIDLLEHFVLEAHARWPSLAWVGLGDPQLDTLPKIWEWRRRNPQSRISKLPAMSVHKAWSRLYVIQSQKSRWMAASHTASWQASEHRDTSLTEVSVPSSVSTEPQARSLAGIREWRWPDAWRKQWQAQLRKLSHDLSSHGPPHPIVAIEMGGSPLTKTRLQALLEKLETHPELRIHERAVAWIRDPLIFESDVQDLNQVLRDRQLSLQVAESRVLLMSSCPRLLAPDIIKKIALQASDI
ncbi:MAG TPA: hypothetical protein PLZ57_04195 [Pseudobdellovibrionaceae bacterium]|nr:hypothetical protein [Pseudobdellovibrionaceae bacterium]